MRQDIIAVLYGEFYRFHQPPTRRGSVAGIHVNVLAPETFWTVIGVAVSFDGRPTLLAGEIFNAALEFFVHWSVSPSSSSTARITCFNLIVLNLLRRHLWVWFVKGQPHLL